MWCSRLQSVLAKREPCWVLIDNVQERIVCIKGTPGCKNKLILIDSQLFGKTNGVTFIFIEKLGDTFLPDQFWQCLSFASLSVPSSMAFSPDFWSCEPTLKPLYCCDMKLCGDWVGIYGLNGYYQLQSQLRIMQFNSKKVRWNSDIAQNIYLIACLLLSTHNLS